MNTSALSSTQGVSLSNAVVDRYEHVYNNFYRVERCGIIGMNDGGGPFGFDILLALLFDDLLAAYKPDVIIECGSFVGDTTVYLGRVYPNCNVLSCDIDASYVRFAQRRTTSFPHVKISCEPSVKLIETADRAFDRPLYFLDAHSDLDWPLKAELEHITHGIAVVHDFDIGHPRFAYDHYDGVSCDAALLATVFPAGQHFYKLNPLADSPFPCLQVGRRTGVAVLPIDWCAQQACDTVANNTRYPLVPMKV